MANEAMNALFKYPLGVRREFRTKDGILDMEGIAARTDLADLSHAERNSSECAFESVPFSPIHERAAGTGD